MREFRNKAGYICDMDGVIYHGDRLLPGAKEFVEWLYRENKNFLFLTNASGKTPKELQQKLGRMGLDVDEKHFYTSALATAKFVSSQKPNCSAYVIGDPGLFLALSEAGITNNSVNPDYVIIGETNNYNYENICQAVHHVQNGAKLVGTNTDLTGPTEQGIVPACRALIAPIELTTGKQAYFVGKPNPLMMRTGLQGESIPRMRQSLATVWIQISSQVLKQVWIHVLFCPGLLQKLKWKSIHIVQGLF